MNFNCLFCEAEIPVPKSYDNYIRCPCCNAVVGFEAEGDGWEFPFLAGEELALEPEKLEVRSRYFDTLTDPDDPSDPGIKYKVYFGRSVRLEEQ